MMRVTMVTLAQQQLKTNEENATIASGIWVESRLQCRSPINTVSCLYATTKSKVKRKLTLFKTII